MRYAEIATERPINRTLTYHIPPALDVRVGHLVRLEMRTAAEPGIVVALHNNAPMTRNGEPIQTKPIIETLDPEPVVTPEQIALARWMSDRYLAPLGPCLWLMLPPGMVGKRELVVSLVDVEIDAQDNDQRKLLDALARRGPLTGTQIGRIIKRGWQRTVADLEKRGAVTTASTLAPPRIKPRQIQVAALVLHPQRIKDTRRFLGKSNRVSDLLETLAQMEDDTGVMPTLEDALDIPGVGQATLDHLLESGLVDRYDGTHISLPEDIDSALFALRTHSEIDLRVLELLAREGKAVDVSWVYAQTDADLTDLKRLDARNFITLGERQAHRDTLADRDFVPMSAPRLTPGQRVVWSVLRAVLAGDGDPLSASPVDGGGATKTGDEPSKPLTSDPASEKNSDKVIDVAPSPSTGRAGVGSDETPPRSERWYVPQDIWRKIAPLAREMRSKPTPAENKLWRYLRQRQLLGVKFRRQHAIDRFIVDFYSQQAMLIIEIDGESHQDTQTEDQTRQQILEALGFRVLRFTNTDVYENLDGVVAGIAEWLQAVNPTRQPAAATLPESGEGKDLERDDMSADEQNFHDSAHTPAIQSTGVTFLLHGVTGSGKTEIYLRAIEKTLAQGKQAMLLVPEIALTAQTIRRVMARFPGRVAVPDGDEASRIGLTHSSIKPTERYDLWHRARAGEVDLIVGTRAALFTPLPDLGLVILDEEHDHSYKQSPPAYGQQVFYHTRDIAERMIRQRGGMLILGSATPDVETYLRAQRGEIGYLQLPDRIMGHQVRVSEQSARIGVKPRYIVEPSGAGDAVSIPLPPVNVVDMRRELKMGNTSMFSLDLQNALRDTLKRGEQAILFLNRRGAATYVFCRDCGYVVHCANCDLPLIYHRQDDKLHCHHCGRVEENPRKCPECGSSRIKYFGAGTQQVEDAFKSHFPHAVALRWDSDTAAKSGAHDLILQRFSERHADVLIGTQMIAKGLDLPLVTLVGVINADVGLNLPDFRAGERTFQLLTQVAGRAGRGLLGGQVILQTYQPGNYAIQAAAEHDYDTFYTREIAYRRQLGYPPFRRMVRLLFTDENAHKARSQAEWTADAIRTHISDHEITDTQMIGPVPCYFSRVNNVYRWQILLRGPLPERLLYDFDFGRPVYVDVDPIDVL